MNWLHAFDPNDPINAEIWTESPNLQAEIFPACWPEDGLVAAAQALVGPPALSWAPDLVGFRWQKPGAVLAMGVSYADFFSPRCRREKRMQLCHYRAASGPADFQAAFLRHVVDRDRDYYEKVADLLRCAGISPEWAVITDLCRASFVKWGARGTSAKEQEVLQEHETEFLAYVRANVEWHNARLDEGGFHVIVALGNLAARGLKEWLLERGWRAGNRRRARNSWVRAGGPSWRTLTFESPAGRVVHVLRAPHPGSHYGRPADVAEDLRRLRWGDTAPTLVNPPPVVRRRRQVDDEGQEDAPSGAISTAGLAHSKKIEPRTAVATIDGVGKKFKRLTFKKRVIDQLLMDQVFEVVTTDGIYSFTKAEFLDVFPKVVNTTSYREDGVYHFKPPTPKRAHRFLLPARDTV